MNCASRYVRLEVYSRNEQRAVECHSGVPTVRNQYSRSCALTYSHVCSPQSYAPPALRPMEGTASSGAGSLPERSTSRLHIHPAARRPYRRGTSTSPRTHGLPWGLSPRHGGLPQRWQPPKQSSRESSLGYTRRQFSRLRTARNQNQSPVTQRRSTPPRSIDRRRGPSDTYCRSRTRRTGSSRTAVPRQRDLHQQDTQRHPTEVRQ